MSKIGVLEAQIHSLFLLHSESGLLRYEQYFSDKFKNLDSSLFSGYLSAFYNFAKEVTNKALKFVEISDLKIVFRKINRYILVIISDINLSILFLEKILDIIADIFVKFLKKQGDSIKNKTIKNKKLELGFDMYVKGLWLPLPSLIKVRIKKYFEKLIFENKILAAAVVRPLGIVVYSSLPEEILNTLLKELEIRAKGDYTNYKKIFYLLENNQKIISTQINAKFKLKIDFIIMGLYESSVSIGIAEVSFEKIIKGFLALTP